MPVTISDTRPLWDDEKSGWKTVQRTSDRALRPDAYFAIRSDKKYCAFLVEADCGTEHIHRPNLDEKTWHATLLKYLKLLDSSGHQPPPYMAHLGIKCGLMVLIVTTTSRQKDAIKAELSKLTGGKGRSYFLFKVWPEFSDPGHVYTEANLSLTAAPWERVGYEPIYLTNRV
jgi:hypothetical protein